MVSERSSILSRFLTRSYIVLGIFFLIGSGIYLNALDNPFEYDDELYIEKNLNIRDTGNIPKFFVSPRLSTSEPGRAFHYRPFVVSSYALNYALGGLNPVGFHLVNLWFHVGTAFLLFLLIKYLLVETMTFPSTHGPGGEKETGWSSPGFLAAIAAGLIFLVHPFNSEAVNYVTARSSVMSGFFYILSFYCWVRFRSARACPPSGADYKGRRYVSSLLAFAAGMLSKEVVITLPLALWFYDHYFWRDRVKTSLFSRYIFYFPFLLMVLIPYLLMRMFSFGKILPSFRRSITTQLFTELPVIVKHWQMFIWPKGLSLVHDVNIYRELTMPVFLSLVLVLIFIALAFYLLRLRPARWRLVSFFMFWFIIVLLPTIIIPLNAIFQENRGYLAIASFAVIAGIFFGIMKERMNRLIPIGVIALLVVAYAAATVQRNAVWDNEIRLWKDVVEKAPNSGAGYAALSAIYREKGDLYLSLETAKRGIARDPNHFYTRNSLGRTYYMLGDIERAIQEYERSISIDPKQFVIWNELALLYVKKGDLASSEKILRGAVERWPNMPPLYYNLGVVLMGEGENGEAIAFFREALRLLPDYLQARFELAQLLERMGMSDEALREYQELIRIGSAGLSERAVMFGQDSKMAAEIVGLARQRLYSRK